MTTKNEQVLEHCDVVLELMPETHDQWRHEDDETVIGWFRAYEKEIRTVLQQNPEDVVMKRGDLEKIMDLLRITKTRCSVDVSSKYDSEMAMHKLCSTVIDVREALTSDPMPDKYHRHHEIHEGNCITCYNMDVK